MSEQGTTVATQPQAQQGRAVAKAPLRADGGGVMAIVPRDLEEAMRYAKGLVASEIVPDAFRYEGKKQNDINVNLVAMGVLKVLEIGLPPQTGLAFLLPLNGRFTVWGDGAWALLQRAGHVATHKVEWHHPLVNGEPFNPDTTTLDLAKWPRDFGCTVKIWRVGQADPYEASYSVGRAMRAGLWNHQYKAPWRQDPARMIFNRARAYAMRDGFSDDLFGLGITEEVRDYTPAPKAPVVDNSALDDDLPALPAPSMDVDVAGQLDGYISGLAMVPNLAALIEYQQLPNNMALLNSLQGTDEIAHARMIAANAHRYAEIEAQEKREEEAAADAERLKEGEGDE